MQNIHIDYEEVIYIDTMKFTQQSILLSNTF